MSSYGIKPKVSDPHAESSAFRRQKTMCRGQPIAEANTAFVIASDHEDGHGLSAPGVVTSAEAVAKVPGLARQTPRVSVTVRRTAIAIKRLGRPA